ncbi:MAG: site-2 protease family protein, partial [Clostridia bacterium]|nr:site-2 protease family protein [Clostridia bacterium]
MSAVIVIFLTLPVHEFAHGFIADKLGDPTPRYQGRLTLNPIAHIDPIGALGILLFGIGWAKPVSVNARNFKNPKAGMAITALAGPVSNIIMAFISLVLM